MKNIFKRFFGRKEKTVRFDPVKELASMYWRVLKRRRHIGEFIPKKIRHPFLKRDGEVVTFSDGTQYVIRDRGWRRLSCLR